MCYCPFTNVHNFCLYCWKLLSKNNAHFFINLFFFLLRNILCNLRKIPLILFPQFLQACFFLNYRKLSSKSNTLHINLFIAFILRSILSFLKESLFVDGLGLEKDLDFVNGVPRFRQDESVSYLIGLCSQWRIVCWLVGWFFTQKESYFKGK